MKKETLLIDIDAVIQCFEKLTKALEAMFDIFEEEHQAAANHQIKEIEGIIVKKNITFDFFAKNLLDLFKVIGTMQDDFKMEKAQTISQVIDFFVFIKDSFKDEQITKLSNKIIDLASSVLKNSKKTQENVKKNKLIVNRLLGFHRESFHFWQKMISERTKSYDEKGHMRPTQVNQLSVKA